MRLELAGRAVLVTGAASGIGLACARAFLAEGARVAMLDRVPVPVLDGLVVQADVTDESQVVDAIASVVARFGGLDVVVGCAGVSGPVGTPLVETSAADIAKVLAVNVTGQLLVAKHAVPHLPVGGSIVLLASDSAFVSAPGMVPYCASKGAVVALTSALAVELDGIRVNCVCPSIVDTPMARADLGDHVIDEADFPVLAADEVAAHVLYLASPVSRSINGQAVLADFGVSARSGFPA
ncbi:SDR family NAD(P)-dependent oxidoreductase [Actinokineospora sp. NBRC 105648]|uniref:SDR family NAD(P)-dependent oxidoreductase n=1 Tax=Actinokineospora sp. NBRC 105648 TaxID=3032206 RepID=UPI00249FF05E|nr:SDR family NAD(P)-dependent oxidoreductase [Actinokineospora sp. NBRC 105648]GLZ39336.1 3-oxoacyl-ACP reductase [Actinokineospora sp. NBRC 105648]